MNEPPQVCSLLTAGPPIGHIAFRQVDPEQSVNTSANASLGDLDGDGDLDIVLAKGRHWPLHNRVLLNDGRGTCQAGPALGESPDRTYNAAEDSVSVLPVLLGEKLSSPVREATVHHSARGKFAVRQGDWVFIGTPSGDDNGTRGEPQWLKDKPACTQHSHPGELYNLREDLAQRHNRYVEKPELVRKLKMLLEKYIQEGRSTPGAPQKNDVEIESWSQQRTPGKTRSSP
jgi:hypothetical protein